MTYAANIREWCGHQLVVLHGPDGVEAAIAPWCGANLMKLALSPGKGRPAVELVDAPADADTLAATPTRWGSPVLFPFPGRVKNSRFTYRGREYQLDAPGDGKPAIHGFVLKRPFTIDEYGAGDQSAYAVLSCAGDDPDIIRQFPSSFRLELRFHLEAGRLRLLVQVQNTGAQGLPFGFGWHPYFRLPLGRSGDFRDCRLQVQAAATWVLEELVPMGRQRPATGQFDLRSAPALGDNMYDDVFTGIARDERDWTTATVYDDAASLSLSVAAGPSFREWVIYTPPGRPAICLEPYTCPPNAFNLAAAGSDAGMRELEPGAAWEDEITVGLSSL